MWQDSDARAAALGLPLRLVDRSPDQILDWAAWTLDASAGTWVLGAPGATAELVRSSAEPCYTHRDGHRLEGQTPRAAFRLDAAADLRAFQWIDAYAGAGAPAERTVLTAPLDDGWQPCHTITPLGADLAAVIPAARTQHLVDLGVGGPAARFCIRTGDETLLQALTEARGLALVEALPRLAPLMTRISPTRVITTAAARVEILTPIPAPDGRSPDGPHTHLLPDLIAAGRPTPPGLALPTGYPLAAIFYPNTPSAVIGSRP